MKIFNSNVSKPMSLDAFKAKARDAVVKEAIDTIVGGALADCHKPIIKT